MNKLGLGKFVAVSSLLTLLAACGVDSGNVPQTNQPPTVTLTATPQSGPAPLAVTLSASATDPEGDALSYEWSLAGAATTPTVTYNFEEAGNYPVTVTVSDGQNTVNASTSVTVSNETSTPPTNPPTAPNPPANPPSDPSPPSDPEPELSVSATPGGPAPWGVRYDVTASGFPEDSTFQITCRTPTPDQLADGDSYIVDNQIDEDSFACLYLDDSTSGGYVSVISAKGDELGRTELELKVTENENSIIFEGTWTYIYTYTDGTPTQEGTFTINEGDEATGTGGDFTLRLYELNADIAIEYEDLANGEGSSHLIPDPKSDGTQRYIDGTDRSDGVSISLEKVK